MPGVSPGRWDSFPYTTTTILLLCLSSLLLQGNAPLTLAAPERLKRDVAADNSTTTSPPGGAPSPPGGTTHPTLSSSRWMECHGFPEGPCNYMKQKLAELQTILAQRAAPSGKGVYARQVAPPGSSNQPNQTQHALEDDLEDEQVFLTPEQIQYFINTLGNRRRYRRKVDSFGQFVSKWQLPIKFAFDGTHGVQDREKIKQAISHWETQTCVRFKQIDPDKPDPSDPNRILFMKYRGCGSYIGKVNISPQPVDLASRCLRHFGIIAHEIGHVIGFWHEHQRSDRDSYIQIKTSNAVVGLSFVSELMRLGRTSNLLPYDYGSVLHYSAKTMSANGDYTIETKDPLYLNTIGQRTGLSFLDAKLANMVYCSDSCPTPLPEPCQHDGYQDPNACHQCRCPDGLTGTYCGRVAPSVNAGCGGVVSVYDTPQYMTSPNYYLGYYNDHTECTWLLQAPVGYKIQFRFESEFGIYCIDGVCFHWVEVRYHDSISNIGPRFCCGKLPQVTLQSTANQMMVLFRSNYSTFGGDRRGFKATYWTVPDSTPNQTPYPNGWYTNGPNVNQARGVTQPSITTKAPPPSTRRPAVPRVATPLPTPPPTAAPPTRVAPAVWPTPKPGQKCSPLDVAVILDSSGSVGVRNWPKVIEFAVGLARRLPIGYDDVRIGAVSFGTTATLHFSLLSYTDEAGVVGALRNIRWKDQMTNTSGGIWLTREFVFTPSGGDRPWAPNVAILVTDGEANRDEGRTIPEAEIAKQRGITLKVVGVGNRLKRPEVEAIASRPLTENLFFVNSFDSLNSLQPTLVETLCDLTKKRPTAGTSRPYPVTTGIPPGPTSGRITTYGPALGCLTPGPADIAFVVDSSGSIGPVNWRKVLDFLIAFVSQLIVNGDQHRVGVVTYGTYGQFQFGLDTYQDPRHLKAALNELRWLDEMTNTSGGIYVMKRLLFDSRSGDRPGVPNIGIVLTDGESNRDPQRVRPEADSARAAGISMFVIGVGNRLNNAELEAIANRPTDRYLYRTRDFNDLEYVIVNIINVMCEITSSTSRPSSPRPTYTPYPTRTPYPTQSPYPTRTPYPTQTPYPTWTPYPTRTPYPKQTPYPTWTPYPTQTPYPTRTPYPTQTPYPTWTPYPTRPPYTTRPTYPSRTYHPPTPIPSSTYRTSRKPVDCSRSRVEVAFVLDSSGSVGANNWPLMMNFTKALTRLLPYGQNQFSVITFGNEATLNIRFNQYTARTDFFAAVDRIRWKDEWTNTSGGLRVMREELFRFRSGDSLKVGILVTDGESNRDRARTLPEARLVHQAGITMFAIGVGPNIDLPELEQISSDPRATYLRQVDDFRRLWTQAAPIADVICTASGGGGGGVNPTPYPTPTTTRTNSLLPNPSYQNCYPLDIAIMIDSSNCIGGLNDWGLVLRFVTELIRSLPVGPNQVRIGVVTFGNQGRLEFPLERYPYVDTLLDAILNLQWSNQRTNISGAILVMRSELFRNTDWNRISVPKVGILITAGKSDLDSHLTTPEANVARHQGIEMFTVGVTSQVDRDELNGIANDPVSAHAFYADRFDTLYQIRDNILRSMCARYDPGLGRPATPPPVTSPSSTPTTTTAGDVWSPWTSCSRPCGGCGRMWRSQQCQDGAGHLKNCGIPEEKPCNSRPCNSNDVCTYYVAWRQYNRPCQPCCYGYEPDYTQNVCIPT